MPSIKAQSRFYVNPYMWFVHFFCVFLFAVSVAFGADAFCCWHFAGVSFGSADFETAKVQDVTDMGYGAGLLFDDFNRPAGNIFIFRDG